MNKPYLILDAFILFYGVNGLWTCVKMLRGKHLVDSRMVVPNGYLLTDCADPTGYYRHILPRMLAFSLAALLSSGVNLLSAAVPGLFPQLVINITIPVFLIALVLFGLTLARAAKRYWT